LRLEDVPVPTPSGDEVLVKVAGCGACHSDLHVLDGMLAEFLRLPVTMGHEISGWVEATGPNATALEPGTPVAVMVGWGCGWCEWCASGHEQICPRGDEAGSTRDGGFAEYVLVPHRRHVIPLGDLDPVKAAPLGDAVLSPYAAVKRVQPHLGGGSTAVVIGAGGLGSHAVQLAKLLTGARVIAVDINDQKLLRAREAGADEAVLGGEGAGKRLRDVTGEAGAQAVMDFVGTDESLALAADVVGRRGIVALLGLAGGSVPFNFYRLAPEASLTTVYAGTVADLQEVVALARRGEITSRVVTYPLAQVNDALDDLRAGKVDGRAVVTP
jgi:propanol-preferring alcohol dehydrogenase